MDIIFDVDGTLLDIEHRRHYVQSKPKNWPAFERGMIHDTLNVDIAFIGECMWMAGARILIASGRGEQSRGVTEQVLFNNGIVPTGAGLENYRFEYKKLYMRKEKDYRSDDIVKREILVQMREDGYNPTIVFDDRQQVVDMWRAEGIRCLQVAEGNF